MSRLINKPSCIFWEKLKALSVATCRRSSLCSAMVLLLLFGIGTIIDLSRWRNVVVPLSHLATPLPRLPAATNNRTNLQTATTPPANSSRNTMTASRTFNVTVPANSYFYIKNPKDSYNMCDVLELYIEVRDGHNVRKNMGGDLLWPYIRSNELKASAPADQLIDHGNGSYTARLTLTWAGLVEPVVRFVHSAEYVAAFREVIMRVPDRFAYVAKFIANKTTEYTPCHMTKVMPFVATEPEEPYSYASLTETCDFSDVKAGTKWYCLKPKTLPCTAIAKLRGDWRAADEFMNEVMTTEEKHALKISIPDDVNLSNVGPVNSVKVISGAKGQRTDACVSLPKCMPELPPKPPTLAAGYYFNDSWRSKVCQERTFKLSGILKCLKGKDLYFYGDSTLRQWFLYIFRHFGRTMKMNRTKNHSTKIVGPMYVVDTVNNITLTFRHHEFPIRNDWINFRDIKFTVNEIDALPGGPNTVVLLAFWAHFTANNMTYYKSRMEKIKAAIQRLHQRGPSPSPVFFKSANTGVHEETGIDMAQPYVYEIDQVMRELFTGVPNVTIIDVWDMTLSHRTGYQLHPVPPVVREEIKMFLNFLCG